ncbi:MAG: DUF3015 family protein [Nitrospiraceae bacterium]
MKRVTVWTILPALLLLASGCTLKATIKETTDTTSNVTGTTSGRTWFTEEGIVKPDFKVTAFIALNEENLRHDMASGQGEYLSSVGNLLNVPVNRQAEFFALIQARYPAFAAMDFAAPQQVVAALRDMSTPLASAQ